MLLSGDQLCGKMRGAVTNGVNEVLLLAAKTSKLEVNGWPIGLTVPVGCTIDAVATLVVVANADNILSALVGSFVYTQATSPTAMSNIKIFRIMFHSLYIILLMVEELTKF